MGLRQSASALETMTDCRPCQYLDALPRQRTQAQCVAARNSYIMSLNTCCFEDTCTCPFPNFDTDFMSSHCTPCRSTRRIGTAYDVTSDLKCCFDSTFADWKRVWSSGHKTAIRIAASTSITCSTTDPVGWGHQSVHGEPARARGGPPGRHSAAHVAQPSDRLPIHVHGKVLRACCLVARSSSLLSSSGDIECWAAFQRSAQ